MSNGLKVTSFFEKYRKQSNAVTFKNNLPTTEYEYERSAGAGTLPEGVQCVAGQTIKNN